MKRFILTSEGIELERFKTIKDLAKFVGCSFQHCYKNKDNTFKYKKVNYQFIDRLQELD